LFERYALRNKQKGDKKITQATERYGYSQKEVADYLVMHHSTISRLIRKETISKNKT
jgi:IS30 family transposase